MLNRELALSVRERAVDRCEYCRTPQSSIPLPFQIDHIVAEKHDGGTTLDNLAFACPHCNRYKGPNIAGRDRETGELVRLFHPRTDVWADHFHFERARVVGATPIGRTTSGAGHECRGAIALSVGACSSESPFPIAFEVPGPTCRFFQKGPAMPDRRLIEFVNQRYL